MKTERLKDIALVAAAAASRENFSQDEKIKIVEHIFGFFKLSENQIEKIIQLADKIKDETPE